MTRCSRIRMPLIVLLAAAAAPPSGAQNAGYAPVSVPVQPERLGQTNVYYIPAESGVPDRANEGLTANAGFVVTAEGVVVYDALGTPSLGAAMLGAVRRVTDRPILRVVVSHYHADHIYGLQAFADQTDAAIVAQARALEYVGSPAARNRLAQRRKALAPWVDARTRVVAPHTTFGDRWTFEAGDSRFTVLHAGPAHAADDAVMMVEPAGVLFSGDIVQNDRVPFLASETVDSARWLEAIERVRAMEPRFMVPGHGRASRDPMPALDFTQGYISDVRERMGQAVANWVSFEEAYAQADWSKYEDLPAFEVSHKRNAYSVYLEMERAALH